MSDTLSFESAPVSFESDNLVVQDISAILPKHNSKKYTTRDIKSINKVIYHQTAGSITKMPDGVLNTAHFFISPVSKPGKVGIYGKDWAGFGYHFFVPFAPDLWYGDMAWGKGRYVVYQCQPLAVKSNHTKTQNDVGVGVVFQGTFTETSHPSSPQQEIASMFWEEILKPALKLTNEDLYGHFSFTKPSCPGPWLKTFVKSVNKNA